MATEINRLTDARVRQLKERGYYNDGGGLYLRIGPTGAKSWVFRYRAGGKQREAGLGPAIRRDPATGRPEVTLVDARIEAAKHANAILALRHGKAEGYDPIERRREMQAVQRVEAASRITFRKCATEFIERNEAAWSNKHRTQWTYTLRDHVYPFIGDLPVAAIDTGLVVQVLDPLWNTKNETANRVRGRIEAVLDYATVRKYREGPNPAQWKGNLAHIFPARSKVQKVEHLAALPYREIGEFMKQLREQGGVAARALEFAILTAARTGEVLGARWTEIDMNERVWTVPASRMKAGKEHRVPLSDAALVLLENQRDAYAGTTRKPIGGYHPATDEFVFPALVPAAPSRTWRC